MSNRKKSKTTQYQSGFKKRQQIKNRQSAIPSMKQAVRPKQEELHRITIFDYHSNDYEDFDSGFIVEVDSWECEIWIEENKAFPKWECTSMDILASANGKIKFDGYVYDIGCVEYNGTDYKIYFCER